MLLILLDKCPSFQTLSIEWLFQIASDKMKFLAKDLQEVKSNQFKLRDEISKEFRKSYKRVGTIDKEIDLMKYRQNMANKKASISTLQEFLPSYRFNCKHA